MLRFAAKVIVISGLTTKDGFVEIDETNHCIKRICRLCECVTEPSNTIYLGGIITDVAPNLLHCGSSIDDIKSHSPNKAEETHLYLYTAYDASAQCIITLDTKQIL